MKEIGQQTKKLPFLTIIIEAIVIVVLIVVLIGKSRDNSAENESNDITKENVENETTTNKKIDDNDIFIPDIAEKDLIKKSLEISKDTTEEEVIAIFGDDYMIDLVNEEHNYKRIEWNNIEKNNNIVVIRLKDNKCNHKSIYIDIDDDITKGTEITEELYYKLKLNSTYDDVKDILGEGTLNSVNISGWDDYGNQEIHYNYVWSNENGSGALIISFDRNLKSKNFIKSNSFKYFE